MKLAFIEGRAVVSVGQPLSLDEAQRDLPPGWKYAPDWVMPGRAYFDERTGDFVAIPVRAGHRFDYSTLELVFDAEVEWLKIRSQRDQLITATDWVALRAADTGEPVPPEWLAYRQALRDITEQADPRNIEWPQRPGSGNI